MPGAVDAGTCDHLITDPAETVVTDFTVDCHERTTIVESLKSSSREASKTTMLLIQNHTEPDGIACAQPSSVPPQAEPGGLPFAHRQASRYFLRQDQNSPLCQPVWF